MQWYRFSVSHALLQWDFSPSEKMAVITSERCVRFARACATRDLLYGFSGNRQL
jgi:hypothetical protein